MPIETFTFENGFRLIYEKSTNVLPITCMYTYCDLGSRYEYENMRGASHFIEHMCFKGTKKIKTAFDLFSRYDKLGAELSAYTTEQYTCYTLNTSDDNVAELIGIISDMILNSTFDKKEFRKEYNVVIEENTKNENDYENLIYEYANKLLYKGSCYEYPIDTYAYHKNSTFSYDEILELYHAMYIPSRMVTSVVTNIPFQTIKKMIEKTHFMKPVKPKMLACSQKYSINYNIIPQTDIQFTIEKKKGMNNTLLFIGFRVCNYLSCDKYALDILQIILGGSMQTTNSGMMSGRLYSVLREEKGLTYHPSIDTEYYENIGSFGILIQTNSATILRNNKSKGVIPLTLDSLIDLIRNGVTQEEVDRAKGNFKGNSTLGMANIENYVEYNASEYFLYNKTDIIPYDDVYDKCYKPVTKTQINDVLKKYLKRNAMSVCVLGGSLPSKTALQNAFNVFNVFTY